MGPASYLAYSLGGAVQGFRQEGAEADVLINVDTSGLELFDEFFNIL